MGTVLAGAAIAHAQVVTATDADVTATNTSTCGPGTNCIANGGTSPTAASTSGALLRDGVFGCSASKYQNPGSLSAVGGIYVPVNDAAVTLNTGYLVYKECVLDGVVSAIKNDAVAGLQRQVLRATETGRNGSAQYVRNIPSELRERQTGIVVANLSGDSLNSMCGAFKSRVQNSIARSYLLSTNDKSGAIYSCPLNQTNSPGGYTDWFATITPAGNIFGATAIAAQKIRDDLDTDERNVRQMWDWSGGFYPTFDNAQNPLEQRVLTPGSVIAASLQQLIGAGTNILVSANEIDQVNGALQASLSATLVTDTIRGLSGLTKSQNGQPSYLDRMAAEASASVRAGAINAAIAILGPARAIEQQYKQAKETIANALTNSITQLRSYENQCWALVVPKVQEYAASQNASITVATTTEKFAQKIIDEQIAPLATTTINDLRASETSLALLDQLIASVTNSSSAANQQAAIERLDSMVGNGLLHDSQEAQNAAKQAADVTAAITTLLDDTKTAWGDSTDTGIGWCNINNPDVITMWFNKWRQ